MMKIKLHLFIQIQEQKGIKFGWKKEKKTMFFFFEKDPLKKIFEQHFHLSFWRENKINRIKFQWNVKRMKNHQHHVQCTVYLLYKYRCNSRRERKKECMCAHAHTKHRIWAAADDGRQQLLKLYITHRHKDIHITLRFDCCWCCVTTAAVSAAAAAAAAERLIVSVCMMVCECVCVTERARDSICTMYILLYLCLCVCVCVQSIHDLNEKTQNVPKHQNRRIHKWRVVYIKNCIHMYGWIEKKRHTAARNNITTKTLY